MNAWGIDIHDPLWTNVRNQIWRFRNEGHMSFIILKGTMGLGNSPKAFLDEAVSFSRDAGLILGLYGWIDPIYPLQPQIDRFKGLIDTYNPDFVAGDFEQYWSNWQQYWDYLNGKITYAQLGILDPVRVANFGHEYMTKLRAFGKPTFLYTAKWFVDGYVGNILTAMLHPAPENNPARAFGGMELKSTVISAPVPRNVWRGLTAYDKSWMGEFELWDADYFKLKSASIMYTWDQFFNLCAQVLDAGPSMPYWTSRKLRQWQSRITLPNMPAAYGNLDTDFWSGSEQEMKSFFGLYVPPEPPPPEPPQGITVKVIATDGLNIRADHSTTATIVESVPMGTELTVVRIWAPIEAWGQLENGNWIALKYRGNDLVEPVID